MTDVPHQQIRAAVAPELVAVRVVLDAAIGLVLVVGLLGMSDHHYHGGGGWPRMSMVAVELLTAAWCVVRGFWPALRFVVGRGAAGDKSWRRRISRMAVLSVLVATAMEGASCMRATNESASWAPMSLLTRQEVVRAPHGIVIPVYGRIPVVEVWRHRGHLMPWLPQHEPCAFRARRVSANQEQVLVECAPGEPLPWSLGLRYADDHWVSVYPNVPAAQAIDEAAWQSLWATAEQRGH